MRYEFYMIFDYNSCINRSLQPFLKRHRSQPVELENDKLYVPFCMKKIELVDLTDKTICCKC